MCCRPIGPVCIAGFFYECIKKNRGIVMYQALYRKWRPNTFEEMVGQNHISTVLKNQIANNQVGHAYLFSGTRGTGKTSSAKLFAKGVNCLGTETTKPCGLCQNCKDISRGVFADVIEIDGASYNGVDNIRELRESVQYPPVAGKYKVYIIDEVHMLSKGAFNAFLKTLEEPPEGVIFILATTEANKIPQTILSRCQRYNFKRIANESIGARIKQICEHEGIDIMESGIYAIVSHSDGSLRDAISFLEQCISLDKTPITAEVVKEVIGGVSDQIMGALTDDLIDGNLSELIVKIDELMMDGVDLTQLCQDWAMYFRNIMLVKDMKNSESMLWVNPESLEKIKEQSKRVSPPYIYNGIETFLKIGFEQKWIDHLKLAIEVACIKIINGSTQSEQRETYKNLGAEPIPKGILKQAVHSEVKVSKEQENNQENSQENSQEIQPVEKASALGSETMTEGDLFSQTLQLVIKERPSARLLSQGVCIEKITEKTITLSVDTDYKYQVLHRNIDIFSEKFKGISGKDRNVLLEKGNGDQTVTEEKTVHSDQDVILELEALMGTDKISVEE